MKEPLLRRIARVLGRIALGVVVFVVGVVLLVTLAMDLSPVRELVRKRANAELEKLALYRPGGTVARDDIEALVGEAVPGSTWAFLDALGSRSTQLASSLAASSLMRCSPLWISSLSAPTSAMTGAASARSARNRPISLDSALRRACACCTAVWAARTAPSSSASSAAIGDRPRRPRARSSASGRSRTHFRSSTASFDPPSSPSRALL